MSEYEKKEKCGLFGIWGTPDASQITYQGLFAQQHRGQESAGIAVTDGTASQRPHRHGAGQPGLHAAHAEGRADRPSPPSGMCDIRRPAPANCATPSRCFANICWARWRWPTTAISSTPRCSASNTKSTAIFFKAPPTPKSSFICWPSPRMSQRARSAAACAEAFAGGVQPAVSVPRSDRSLPRSLGRAPAGARQNAATATGASPAKPARSTPSAPPSFARSNRARSSASTTHGSAQPARLTSPAASGRTASSSTSISPTPPARFSARPFTSSAKSMGRQLAHRSARAGRLRDADARLRPHAPPSGLPSESQIPFEEGIVPNRFVGRTFILPNQAARDRAVAMKLNIIPDVVERQADRDRGRFGRARHDDAIENARHPRRRREGDPSARQLPADPPSLLLRHRLPHQRRTDRPQSHGRRDPRISRSRQPRVSLARRHALLHETSRSEQYCTACWSGEYKIPIDHAESKFSFERDQLQMFNS